MCIRDSNNLIQTCNKGKSLVVAEIFCYFKGFCRLYSCFCLLDQKYKRGVMQSIFRQSSQDGWTTVKLGTIFKKVSRRNTNGDIKNVITNSAEYGLIPQRDFFDKDIAVDGNTSNYYVIDEGDFVYNPRKSNTAPYGPFNRYTLKEKGIISPLYTCLVLQADINPAYLAWYFKSDAWYRYICLLYTSRPQRNLINLKLVLLMSQTVQTFLYDR